MENKDINVMAGLISTKEEPVEDEFVPNNPLNRPKMHYTKPIIALSAYLIQLIALFFIPFPQWWVRLTVILAFSIVYFAIIAKRAIIWSVHLYQNKASDETRLKCVFEPSCSEYMIMAVQKYGVIRGVFKGVRRLFTCGHESGTDYP
jgi:putative component of membrane protein insertase Oxa1/YidC/SpoIIIJ protein YidD